ncbi:BTAD domain-containing putative transcriptional regulator [Streptomyces sp. NPDC058960]|uniref:AfsR/SARP family transcriptional regulator n=1 Tax=Streptomyces sp. NPDC058960 TaxID=3346679 RepID=UPI0036AF2AF5
MEFRLLGNVEVLGERGAVPLPGAKVRTALAALVLARGWPVPDSALTSALWGWHPPDTRTAQLYTYMSRLRRLLGPSVRLERQQSGYLLHAQDAAVDVLEFEQLAAEGARALRQRQFERASRRLGQALRLWRGTALADVTEHLADAERPRLEEARALALEDRLEADLALGRHRELIAELTGLVHAFPLRERLRAQLMTALYRCDRQSDALAVYHHGRQLLADELGVDPGPTLSAAYQTVLNNAPVLAVPPAGRAAAPVPAASADAPAMLPPPADDFTGRQRELAELARLLPPWDEGEEGPQRPRRFLLTGMAGVGKSTLAVQVAHTVAASFPEGQLYADLRAPDGAPRDPRTVLSELLRALGDGAEDLAGAALPAYVQRYRARTAGKALLVVLDNLVAERQLDPLLPGGTGSAVVVTARTHPAAVSGIRTVVLEPLRPGESLTLLGAMAGASRLAREPEAARDLVAYCEGLPLALRAVGARLAARPRLPLSWLADRLAEPEARLGELRYGELSVAASLAHSLHGLDDIAVAVLRSLPALGGRPFTAAEAAGRAGSAEPASFEQALDRLADARLLDLSAIDDRGQPLYRCPGLVQLFARSLEAPAPGQAGAGAGAHGEAQAGAGAHGQAQTPALAAAPGQAQTPALAGAPGQAQTPAVTGAPGGA